MPNLIYRIVSACCALGYGYTAESIAAAITGRVDVVVCNSSAIHAGLDTDRSSERGVARADLVQMVAAGKALGSPVILGGWTMDEDFDLRSTLAIARDVLAAEGVPDHNIAIIARDNPPSNANNAGVASLITALQDGARYIIIDRHCDSALFASDMVRRGIDADLAYHVGRVLESGARARDAASHFESLVAEIYDDRSTIFVSPATRTRTIDQRPQPRPTVEAPALSVGHGHWRH